MDQVDSLAFVFLTLALAAVGVVVAGVILARTGDVIAARTRLGGLWVGLVFLAFATSLPELITAGTAVRLGAIDLAAGDLFGSNMANMAILALLNLVPGAALFRRAALDQGLAASHAIILTSVAAASIILAVPSAFLGLGPGSLLLLAAYLMGSRTLYRHAETVRQVVSETETVESPEEDPEWSLGSALLRFLGGTLLVAVSAPSFAISAERAVELTGLSEGFVGALVLGVATSLPELVVSLAALRVGAYDLAVANLFGSNAINMVMFAPLDLVYGSGPILAVASDTHVVAALASIVMMALDVAAIDFSPRRSGNLLEPSSALIILVYLAALAALYGGPGPGGGSAAPATAPPEARVRITSGSPMMVSWSPALSTVSPRGMIPWPSRRIRATRLPVGSSSARIGLPAHPAVPGDRPTSSVRKRSSLRSD